MVHLLAKRTLDETIGNNEMSTRLKVAFYIRLKYDDTFANFIILGTQMIRF